jgi:hypothetical protein
MGDEVDKSTPNRQFTLRSLFVITALIVSCLAIWRIDSHPIVRIPALFLLVVVVAGAIGFLASGWTGIVDGMAFVALLCAVGLLAFTLVLICQGLGV